MKLIINGTVYEMGDKEYEWILTIASHWVPFGIYAVVKDGVCELRIDECCDEKELNALAADYIKNGFGVYANRSMK